MSPKVIVSARRRVPMLTNWAVLPGMRVQCDGLVLWVGSSSSRGGAPPYLGLYFAAKAAEGSLAISYAAELARFGIETTIVVPAHSRRAPTTSQTPAVPPMTMSPRLTRNGMRASWMK